MLDSMQLEPTSAPSPQPQPQPPLPRPSHLRRTLRAAAWTLAGVLTLVLVLAAGAWWWLGSNQSLATAIARAARYLPAEQMLEAREVTGSVRAGGRIGWLRWQSPTLAVEVREARIGWQLAPLLRRQFKLGEVQAAQITIERRGPADDKPLAPLGQLVLPIDIDLPFRVDLVRWMGSPALEARGLAGRNRFADAHH